MKGVLTSMFEVVREILSFSTEISSENIAEVVLDSKATYNKDSEMNERTKQIS